MKQFKTGDIVTIVRDRQTHADVCHYLPRGSRCVVERVMPQSASPWNRDMLVFSLERGHKQFVVFDDIELADTRRLRFGVRSTYTKGPLQVRKFGVAFGYWPCLRAPFVSVALGSRYFDVWFGLPSYHTGGQP